MVPSNHNDTNNTVLYDPAVKEVQLINYGFKIDSDRVQSKRSGFEP